MHNKPLLIILIFVGATCLSSFAQQPATTATNPGAGKKAPPIQKAKKGFPQISLQEALQAAETYIRDKGIDVSAYYLAEIRIEHPEKSEPVWLAQWVNPNSDHLPSDMWIRVSMDGKASGFPGM